MINIKRYKNEKSVFLKHRLENRIVILFKNLVNKNFLLMTSGSVYCYPNERSMSIQEESQQSSALSVTKFGAAGLINTGASQIITQKTKENPEKIEIINKNYKEEALKKNKKITHDFKDNLSRYYDHFIEGRHHLSLKKMGLWGTLYLLTQSHGVQCIEGNFNDTDNQNALDNNSPIVINPDIVTFTDTKETEEYESYDENINSLQKIETQPTQKAAIEEFKKTGEFYREVQLRLLKIIARYQESLGGMERLKIALVKLEKTETEKSLKIVNIFNLNIQKEEIKQNKKIEELAKRLEAVEKQVLEATTYEAIEELIKQLEELDTGIEELQTAIHTEISEKIEKSRNDTKIKRTLRYIIDRVINIFSYGVEVETDEKISFHALL